MSFAMIDAVKWLKVTPTQKLVLLCLADFHNGMTGRCDPSYASIMELTGLSNRAIADAILALREANILGPGGIKGARTSYTFTIKTSEPNSQEVVSQTHKLAGSERGSPVSQTHKGSEPDSQPPVNLAPKPVSEAHTNRKEPEIKPEGTSTKQGASESPPNGKVKPSKPDWREWNRQKAEEANTVQKPLLAPPEFVEAWQRFCAYRTRRATQARIAAEAIEWTRDAAEGAIRSCERHADQFGWPAVVAQIDTAIAGGWRGLNFQNVRPQHQQRTDRHAAYTPERAKARLAPGQSPQDF